MDDIVKIDSSNISAILHSRDGLTLTRPFSQQIFLVDVHIAGTTHVDNIDEIEPTLTIGKKLVFFREPGNKYDDHAIAVKDKNGNKLGYIPKDKNEILSRLMDAGKLLYGIIQTKEKLGDWLKISMQVFLED
jgi:hypothetical protein